MKKKIIIIFGIIFSLTLPAQVSAKFFTDVSPEHTNFTAITYLSDQGVLNGFSDGSFKPDQKVNRAEALKILILGSGLEAEGIPADKPFPDVPRDEWFSPYVFKAKNLGVIKGTAEGYFEPTRTVNRAEALKMLILVNGIQLEQPEKSPYLDIGADEWFASYFAFAKNNNFFDNPNYAQPAKDMTRGELAEIFYRLEKWKENDHPDEGGASYLADFFEGRNTANGEVFDQDKYTAAHQTFPFGTKILVTNQDNNKSVIVKINDRGPYAEGRIIDLSEIAFEAIYPLSRGLANVRLKELPEDTPAGIPTKEICQINTENDLLEKDFFNNLILDNDIPKIFRKNEIYTIKGELGSGVVADEVTVFIDKKTYSGLVYNNSFEVQITFSDEAGEHEIAMIPGTSGQSKIGSITVYDPICEPNFEEQSQSKPANFVIKNINGKAIFSWEDDWNQLFRLRFTQENETIEIFVNNQNSFQTPTEIFENFQEGFMTVEIAGAPLENSLSNSQNKTFSDAVSVDFYAVIEHERIVEEQINNLNLPPYYVQNQNLKISGTSPVNLKENATIITPSEKIIDVPLSIDGNDFVFNYAPTEVGTYIIEINDTGGFAIINAPVVQKGFVPLLPDYRVSEPQDPLENINLSADRRILLSMVNSSRAKAGLTKVELNDNLNALAQFRASDMQERNYFAHTDPDGKDANDYRVEHAVKTGVFENIAMDINLSLAHNGLMRSPIHRRNILNENWQEVGIGLAKRESGEIIVVELFSEEPFDNNNLASYRDQILKTVNDIRNNPLIPNVSLQSIAQSWSKKMSDSDFFDFSSSDGDSLQSLLENAGIQTKSSALIFKVEQFSSLISSFSEIKINLNNQESDNILLEENWQNLGVGIYGNEVGQISVTIIVSE